MTPIIIDTDPGKDDAVEILAALGRPDLELVGITCVAGNVPLHHTSANALRLVELAGRTDVPVHAGAPAPLVGPLVTAEEVHGPTGLEGPDLPAPTTPLASENAVGFLIDSLRARRLTLCALGPLTNIALALRLAPDIAGQIERIVLMGGGYFVPGNVTPAAEFNFHVDPHAAQIVLEAGVPVTILPLDVTHKVLASASRLATFRASGNRPSLAVASILEHYAQPDCSVPQEAGGPIHDANVIGWLVAPELYQGRDCHVAVETRSELTFGASVVDYWGKTPAPANAHWVTEAEAGAVFTLITEAIGRL